MRETPGPREIARRSFVASAAIVPVTAIRSAAKTAESVFSRAQSRCLGAFVNRLVPSDESGPGAVECGVVEYMDRSLAGPLAGEKAAIAAGLDAVDAFSHETHAAPLAELPPDQQDAVLTAFEAGNARGHMPDSAAFFARIRRLTLEGMFCDPSYGGNRNFAGWDLIRYPGPRMAVSAEDQTIGASVKPVRYSVNGGGRGR
jgi:gluconate 2-dehydrogenase gamma chain